GAQLHYATILRVVFLLWHNTRNCFFGMHMTTFSQEHARRLKDLEARAKAAGSNMTQVCKTTGIARATYESWVQRAPQTVRKLDELEAEVARLEKEAAKQAATANTAG